MARGAERWIKDTFSGRKYFSLTRIYRREPAFRKQLSVENSSPCGNALNQ